MKKRHNGPPVIKDLEKKIEEFVYKNGLERLTVFDDLLTYIIFGYSPIGPHVTSWRYSQEQNQEFFEMAQMWQEIMRAELVVSEWYDPLGPLYMEWKGKRSKQDRGQFYSPPSLTNLLTALVSMGRETEPETMWDPFCGSAAFSVAFSAKNRGSIVLAEDLDLTACKMAICNYLSNTCNGFVIRRNIYTDEFFQGWRVNEFFDKIPIPHVREITEFEYRRGISYTKVRLWNKLVEMNNRAVERIKQEERIEELVKSIFSLFEGPPAENIENNDTDQGTTDNG